LRKRRIFISTGEVSGDLQGALLIDALMRRASQSGCDLEIVALGGDRMKQAGATLLADTSTIGSVGLLESLPYILPTLTLQRRVKQFLRDYCPEVTIMIDYMSPNISLGRHLKQQFPHMPLVYYIAPQEWVWSFGARNTYQIVSMVDQILAIFPEEANYYATYGASVTWVGHPLVDLMKTAPSRQQARQQFGIPPEQVAIALFPASRHQEIRDLLPVIFETARRLQEVIPDVWFWIPLSLEAYRQSIEDAIAHYGLRATLVTSHSQAVIAAADLAITKSGTVTLELALMQVPQLVLYRVGAITAWIARRVLKFSIPFMSPTNLVLMEPIVPEFLQEQANPDALTAAALELLKNPQQRQQMLDHYQQMQKAMGEPGVCDRVAHEIFKHLSD
jgi:lipid-A-disaccharide synthase